MGGGRTSVLRFFRGHLPALACVAVLLVIQAFCELSLPQYMSDIVNVGVGQGGIVSAVPTKIKADDLSDLEMFMDDDARSLVESCYSGANGSGVRSFVGRPSLTHAGSELADALALPEAMTLMLQEGVDASSVSGLPRGFGSTIDLDSVRSAYESGIVTRDQLASYASSLEDHLGEAASTIIEARAVEYVSQTYDGLGMDLGSIESDYLMRTAGTMLAFCLVGLLAAVGCGLVAARTGAAIARDTRHDLFEHVMDFSPAEVGRFSQASLITRCTNDVQQVQMTLVMFMRMVMLAPVMGVVAIVKVASVHSGLEWTIMAAVLALIGVMAVLFFFTMPKFRQMQRLVDRVNLVAREMLDGLLPIRAFCREDHELRRFDEASSDLMATQLFTNHAMALMMPLMMFLMNAITVVIVWFGAHSVSAGLMQVGDVMAFISYAMQIVMSFLILAMVAILLPRASVAADRIWEVLGCPLSIVDPTDPVAHDPDAPRGELVFDHVGFSYPDSTSSVVSDVSFEVGAGSVLGIVGSTGSGKSTLVQLVPRLYDVTEGSVSLDGVDVRRMSLSDLRSRVGYVPQQGRLFSGTVASNVVFADVDVTDEDIERALRVSQSEEFVSQMPDGADSPITQGGTNVSGGQRQRLAIARALAAHPEVLVLDDSFSALDYATDAALRRSLAEEENDVTVVVVAQRVASVMHADRIIVLDEGSVVGDGTHEELLRSCPTYREIATSQLSEKELGLEAEVIPFVPRAPEGGDE